MKNAPLAYRLSPTTLQDYIGQSHLVGDGKPLQQMIETDTLASLILWGPPGCGKTSLSKLISHTTHYHYVPINAVNANIATIKQIIKDAKNLQHDNKKTLIFIDEIHRFNKTQQDALLPEVESGLLTLIGATTENPFFSVISALISRCQVFQLQPLTPEDLTTLYTKAIKTLNDEGTPLSLTTDAQHMLFHYCSGDVRKLYNCLELLANTNPTQEITPDILQNYLQEAAIGYSEDDHYNFISALIKSMRGSDADASLYWLARLISGGEKPEYIARRLVIFASEDISNADPQALILATSCLTAVLQIGMPESQIILSQVVTYLATAPKSNASYTAIKSALKTIKSGTRYPVPDHLKSSQAKGYLYPHDYDYAVVKQEYLPHPHNFYSPKGLGFEKTIKTRMDWVKQRKEQTKY